MTNAGTNRPRTVTEFSRSDDYRARVHDRITGGAHTYSKGDDQFPVLSPAAISHGRDGHVWDLDGNEFIDCGLGLGSVSLGHAYGPVLDAVRDQLLKGAAFSRPAAIELETADLFLSRCPGMDRIKFAKNGSNVTTAAVKLARAYTGRPLVAFPANHPFYSFDDWFIGSTLVNSGVPDATRNLAVTYQSTDPGSLESLFRAYPGQIACVITEPDDIIPNPPEIIQDVERITKEHDAVFILDEMVTGYRMGFPGAYPHLGLTPDLVTWGKAIGNGFSFCALTGRAEIMDLGGIRQTARPRVFLLSSTHGGEAHTLAAGQAVLREYEAQDVLGRHNAIISATAKGMAQAIEQSNLSDYISVYASPWRLATICRDADGDVSQAMRTLLMQEMIGDGVLYQGFMLPTFTHTDEDIDRIVHAFDNALDAYASAIDRRSVEGLLVGAAAKPLFRRYA